MIRRNWASALCAVALSTSAATATPRVVAGAGCTIVGTPSVTQGGNGLWTVQVSAYGSPSGTLIIEADGIDPIQTIQIIPQTNPPHSANDLNLVLTVKPKTGTSGYVSYLGNVTRVGTAGDLWIHSIQVNGNIGDPSNPHSTGIVAQSINSITATGHIAGDITSTGSAQAAGAIQSISSGGDILGHVKAEAAWIGTVTAASDVGSSGGPVNIWAKTGITRLEGDAIFADVQANRSGTGNLNRLIANTGDFTGAVRANNLVATTAGDAVTIAGDLDGDMIVSTNVLDPIFIGGSVLSSSSIAISGVLRDNATDDGRIVIGGSLTGDLTCAASGLLGQVTINANDASGTWAGDVIVGSTTLTTPPHYSQISSSLGGGAVGLVPFSIHSEDCEPANGSVACAVGEETWPGASVRETLVLNHYGPILDTSPGGMVPVIVESLDLACPIPGSCPVWVDITNDCEVLVAPGGATRQLWVSLSPNPNPIPFSQAYKYRVRPRDSSGVTYLRSNGTGLVTAPNVASYTYEVTIICTPP